MAWHGMVWHGGSFILFPLPTRNRGGGIHSFIIRHVCLPSVVCYLWSLTLSWPLSLTTIIIIVNRRSVPCEGRGVESVLAFSLRKNKSKRESGRSEGGGGGAARNGTELTLPHPSLPNFFVREGRMEVNCIALHSLFVTVKWGTVRYGDVRWCERGRWTHIPDSSPHPPVIFLPSSSSSSSSGIHIVITINNQISSSISNIQYRHYHHHPSSIFDLVCNCVRNCVCDCDCDCVCDCVWVVVVVGDWCMMQDADDAVVVAVAVCVCVCVCVCVEEEKQKGG